jgi:hypothetical protein
MTERETTSLLSIEMVRDKFPAEARPSARLVRETAQRLGHGRRWGRNYYLTEGEAKQLMLAGSERKPETRPRGIRTVKRPRPSEATDRALALSRLLEKPRAK